MSDILVILDYYLQQLLAGQPLTGKTTEISWL